jgi:hypothetical protein
MTAIVVPFLPTPAQLWGCTHPSLQLGRDTRRLRPLLSHPTMLRTLPGCDDTAKADLSVREKSSVGTPSLRVLMIDPAQCSVATLTRKTA